MARNFIPGDDWVPATVVERTEPVSYLVETAMHQLWKRHVDQLKTLADSVVVKGQDLASTGPTEDVNFEISQPAPVALTTPPDGSGDLDTPEQKIPDNPDPPQSPDPIHPSTGHYPQRNRTEPLYYGYSNREGSS